MSKEYTNYVRGAAILMMLFIHLFQHLDWDTSLNSMFHIGEIPLVYYIARMCDPVPFFLILSGYGLYSVYAKSGGGKTFKTRWQPLYSSLVDLFADGAFGLQCTSRYVSGFFVHIC